MGQDCRAFSSAARLLVSMLLPDFGYQLADVAALRDDTMRSVAKVWRSGSKARCLYDFVRPLRV